MVVSTIKKGSFHQKNGRFNIKAVVKITKLQLVKNGYFNHLKMVPKVDLR